MTDVIAHNRHAWNRYADSGDCPWSQPVDRQTIAAARRGDWQLILTPNRPVPTHWFGDVRGRRVLCLASGGGQQAPVLAAAGAHVTSFDNSDAQLARDRTVAEREGLTIRLEQGDMADLGRFDDASFDLIFHPVSNVFAPAVRPVWRECARVLRPGGRLLGGMANPAMYLFDLEDIESGGPLLVRHRLPYADVTHLSPERLRQRIERGDALEFGHSLDDLIGGQLDAGLVLAGLYEDDWSNAASPLNPYMPMFIATLAVKPLDRIFAD
jgi:SAM-dependent methyltransferase